MFQSKLPAIVMGAVSLLAAGAWSSARAAGILEQSLATPAGTGSLQNLLRPVAESFVASGTTISDLEFVVSTSATSGSLLVTLWADSGTGSGPTGSAIATLASLSLSTIHGFGGSGAAGLVDLYNLQLLSGASHLTSGNTYWIEYAAGASTALYLNSTVATGPTSYWKTALINSTPSGTAFLEQCVSTGNECQGSVFAFPTATSLSVSAPEPATLALLGSALTGIGLARRRQGKKASKD